VTVLTPARRAWLDRALLGAAVAVPLLTAMAALGVDGRDGKVFLALYTAPCFLAFFLWLRLRLRDPGAHGRGPLAMDLAAVAASALRVTGPAVPWSGHMVFYVYSALTTRSLPYRLLVLALAGSATWFKLAVWNDARSWGLGLVLGLFLAARRTVLHRERSSGDDVR
jgi:hypothetical protein